MNKLFLVLLFLSLYSVSYGVFVKDSPFQLVQPNGEVLNVFITGDEFYRRVHDSEGYSIIQREDGWYCYAMYDAVNDELVETEYIVSSNQKIQLPMEKGLGISLDKYIEIRRAYYEPTGCDPSGASKKSILDDLADAKTTQQMSNIVICIGFSDTPGMSNNFNFVNGMINTNANNNMRDYFSVMSYGKLDVHSHFYPPASGNMLRFYQDENPRNYYRPYNATSNPIGYTGGENGSQRITREHTLLRNAVNWVNANWPVPDSLNLDINNDGLCDYITFIVYGQVGGWSDLLWPHKWTLYTSPAVFINGKRVHEYNFMLDASATYFNVGVFAHEGFHVLGAPDLYHYVNAFSNLQAVGSWDLMATNGTKPQSMSAYMKLRYGRWISGNYTHTNFPVAEINKTYEVFPFYTNDGSDPAKPIMHRIPLTGTSTQYTLIEYRKRAGMNYDTSLSGEGLLIYRINTNFIGNAQFDGASTFDEVYLYRPGSSQTTGVYSGGQIGQAPFNTNNGRTAFNSTTNPKPCHSNGTEETNQNINNILYDNVTDSYTFFYGDPENRTMSVNVEELFLSRREGCNSTVNVSSNVLWRVTVPEEATDWLSASVTKGLNDGIVTLTSLSSNDTEEFRTADVDFFYNNETFTVTVIQSNYHIITATSNNSEWGDVTGDGEYLDGAEATLIASAKENYHFVNWTEDEIQVSIDEIYTFEVTADRDLVANFELNTYTVAVNSNNPDIGSVEGGGTFYHNEIATVTATPNPCIEFAGWLKDGVVINSLPVYSFPVIEDVTLTALFEECDCMFTVTIEVNPENAGFVTGDELYYPCQAVTITATPNDNWTFINWTQDGNEISSTATHSFTITNDVTLIANFGNVGINKTEASQFKIYPNPANEELRIKNYELRNEKLSRTLSEVEVEIFDIFGRNVVGAYRIHPITESPNEIVIDVSSLPSGVYMIRMVGDGGVNVQRFTIFR